MDLIVPFCVSARTSIHNYVFLEGVKAALTVAGATEPNASTEVKTKSLKAFARVYAGWGFSQAFYREKLYEEIGFKTLEDFMVNFWETWGTSKDPNNLLCQIRTWQTGDVSLQEPFNGDYPKALGSIKAKALVLPGKTDLYFPPEDSEDEVRLMGRGKAEYKVIPSIWGHWAGGPGTNEEDVRWLDDL